MMIKDLLKGLTMGQKQTAGVMGVIPLLGKDTKTKTASFSEIEFLGSPTYGDLTFGSNSPYPFIIPSGFALMTKTLTQDHALPFATVIPPQREILLPTGCCIQQTQCGHLENVDMKDLDILPLYIRKKHMEEGDMGRRFEVNPSYDSFSRLWEIISNFQRGLVEETEGNLIAFFNKYLDKLMQFNAEFEIVENQRGAIITINDRIVGIEIAPTHEYWSVIWQPLIRDCYGSEVLRQVLSSSNLVKEFKENQKMQVDLSVANSIPEIRKALMEDMEMKLTGIAKEVQKICSKDCIEANYKRSNLKNTQTDLEYSLFKISGSKSYGEIVRGVEDEILYASVLI